MGLHVSVGPMSINQKVCNCNFSAAAVFFCIALFIGSTLITVDVKEKIMAWLPTDSSQKFQFDLNNNTANSKPMEFDPCSSQCRPSGIEALPKGMVSQTSDLERQPLWGSTEKKGNSSSLKNLLAIAVGLKQKQVVNEIVKKNGVTLSCISLQSIKQNDIVALYSYIFLWDEDIGVENFHPGRYLEIVEREGLDVSQPGLDIEKSKVHYRFTERQREGDVHRRIYDLAQGLRCNENSTGFPCAGFVEMMAPVFTSAAWRCAWHMIQNDLIHAWGLDMKLGYCSQGDRTKKVGVVDSEYITHMGIPTLGGSNESGGSSTTDLRAAVVHRCYAELDMFNKRWQAAAREDKCWTDPYPQA
ncbi:Lysine ketoglutarate reductase trans-splicing related [Musa troglodytarum]|uniref:Lysine ketoglutarate reductase trans-splicing related n=1 Tax=Musa troglodytarum TaxID=320322 RepID=A0A9E7EK13_9LILI|nr:Lysine ketoglutarate reductase trans-splicing related [Musa troglodytarum]